MYDGPQAIIENLTFSDVESEGVRSLADANLVKLCRLSQLCLEYLLHCQEVLERYANRYRYFKVHIGESMITYDGRQKLNACEESSRSKSQAEEIEKKANASSKQIASAALEYFCRLLNKFLGVG